MIFQHYEPASTATDAVNAYVSGNHPGAEWRWAFRRQGIFRVMAGDKSPRRHPFIVSYHADIDGVPSWIVVPLVQTKAAAS